MVRQERRYQVEEVGRGGDPVTKVVAGRPYRKNGMLSLGETVTGGAQDFYTGEISALGDLVMIRSYRIGVSPVVARSQTVTTFT